MVTGPLIIQAMGKNMKANPALFVLRERTRKALHLCRLDRRNRTCTVATTLGWSQTRSSGSSKTPTSTRVAIHKTFEGNWTTKRIEMRSSSSIRELDSSLEEHSHIRLCLSPSPFRASAVNKQRRRCQISRCIRALMPDAPSTSTVLAVSHNLHRQRIFC
jgi:hypothetical protein